MDVANSRYPAQVAQMPVSEDRPWAARLYARHALAGLEAGVLGALLMTGWLMLASVWLHRSVWSVPNLFATVFYGPEAYVNAFVHSSLSGVALLLVIYGALGVLWGVVWQEKRHPFLRLVGAFAGLLVYTLFFNFIWPHTKPLVSLYAPNRQLEVAHMLWGIMLAASPRFARNISSATGPAEVRSGEVIL
ncbi:MAG: hypothetical protein QOJ99_1011 [Bryobacterales bacterium]|jgi:hypothetical protein|nr:hypothetical protein [Bryobacterales bacterium]